MWNSYKYLTWKISYLIVVLLFITIISAFASNSYVLGLVGIFFPQGTIEERSWKDFINVFVIPYPPPLQKHKRHIITIPNPKANPNSILRNFQSIKGLELEWVSLNVGNGECGSTDPHFAFKWEPHNPLFPS